MMADRIIPLQIGPGAKLGPSYTVDIERPRGRREMNHDPRFQQLHGEITRHLLQMSHHRDASAGAEIIRLQVLTRVRSTRRNRRRWLR